MRGFGRFFAAVRDPRASNAKHDRSALRFVAFAAVVCGAESCAEMAEFGEAEQDALRQVLRLSHGIPSHDTVRLLDPVAFAAAFRRFMAAFAAQLSGLAASTGQVSAVDGKSRSTKTAPATTTPPRTSPCSAASPATCSRQTPTTLPSAAKSSAPGGRMPISSDSSAKCDSPAFAAVTAAAVAPGEGSLHHPPLGKHNEALGEIGAFDNLHLDLRQNGRHRVAKLRSLIAAVSIQLEQERGEAEECGEQHRAAITILNVGGMNNRLQHQPGRVDKNIPLLAFDLFARVVTRWIDRTPPCILPLPAETKPARRSVDGSPQPPGAIEPVKKHGAPATGSNRNPNRRLGRKSSPHSPGRVMEQPAVSPNFVGIDVSKVSS